MARNRPTLFVGSSSEGLNIPEAIQVLLDHSCEVTIWSQGVFGLGEGALESLVNAVDDFDFAILVLTPDDLLTSRKKSSAAPRDNVLFELGLFMGALGRKRTFAIYNRSAQIKLPSDLAGVTVATFEPHASGNMQSALGAATTTIKNQITRLGVRDSERLKGLSEAAQGFDDAASKMEKLVELIARSRKVELDIVSTQFGPFIDPDKLKQMRLDLVDLEITLNQSKRVAR